MIIHVVTSGETLNSIASGYDLSASYLQNLNQIPNPNNLVVGQTLLILFPEITHVAAPGESLYSIAQQYETTVIQLLRNNPYLHTHILTENDVVVISYQDIPFRSAEINGYVYPNVALKYLSTVLPYLTYITIFTYGINENGTLIDIDDEEIIEWARSYGVAPIMNLSSLTSGGTFSSVLAGQVINDISLQETLIENIILTLTQKNYYGLDVDFEFIAAENAEAYATFITTLKERLNPLGFIVMTDLAPKTSAQQPGSLYEGHSYSLLGEASNLVFLMTYEWGYTYGPPKAVAPIGNVKSVLNYAVTEIPSDKILMGIPNYGYLWTLPFEAGITRATSVSIETALEVAADKNVEIHFDSASATPYYYFSDDNGTPCVVWFEDLRSSRSKLSLINEFNLRGAGYWNLDRPYPQNWMLLNTLYDIIQVNIELSAEK